MRDTEAIAWAYKKLLAYGVANTSMDAAMVMDRLNAMLTEDAAPAPVDGLVKRYEPTMEWEPGEGHYASMVEQTDGDYIEIKDYLAISAVMACGHHISLLVKSVESDYQFCELCECRSMRNDAEKMELEAAALQSLDDVIEECAKVCDGVVHGGMKSEYFRGIDNGAARCARAIRALGKP